MKRLLFLFLTVCISTVSLAQQSTLTVQKIMQNPAKWIGDWPSQPYWSEDGETAYFNWNPKGEFPSDSLYKFTRTGGEPVKVAPEERRQPQPFFRGWQHDDHVYDATFSRKVYQSGGDLYIFDRNTNKRRRLTETNDRESNPRFSLDETAVIFQRGQNVYSLDLTTGLISQMTDFRPGSETSPDRKLDDQDAFLKEQQTELFRIIRDRAEQSELRDAARDLERAAQDSPPVIYSGKKNVRQIQIDPTERFITYTLSDTPNRSKGTKSVTYVTDTGYAEVEDWRSKVGTSATASSLQIYDMERDTTYQVDLHSLPGAYDVPEYLRDQGVEVDSSKTRRDLFFSGPYWRPDGKYVVIQVNARDHKDRWLARLDPETGELTVLDRQHDEAWIGGPGIGWYNPNTTGFIPNTNRFYFQSEKTGYSHLYTVDLETGDIKQLTSGEFEVFNPQLSRDAGSWMFTSSEVSPFERHFYGMPVGGGARTIMTTMEGNNAIALNPDGSTMAIAYSYTNRPTEIYLQQAGGELSQITHSPTEEWLSYDWRVPEIIHFEASDGVMVPAHIFEPENPNGAAVIFVHGAGYLQNVHKWWSGYSREYMFNNMLTDLGYTVINVDYRASAGYGRDWRTAIYRHMGGRDLQDQVDASGYLQATYGIDPERIALYGGSYGGFITLMALFTEAEHFGAGAALRSVTDWAHYNHGYTSPILNTPATDSLAYARSSPIYFADGLEDPLLMPHGMIDSNVHFQDIVRLTQRLIELGKENWELAVYPVERHGFTEPDSWTDEYRRILKLIEENVGPNRIRK